MTTATFSNALLPLAGTDGTPETETEKKPSLFARFVDALVKSREAQAHREIARVEAMLGITILEREAIARGDLPFNS